MTPDTKDSQTASSPVDTTDIMPQSEDTKVHEPDANLHDSITNSDSDKNAPPPEVNTNGRSFFTCVPVL